MLFLTRTFSPLRAARYLPTRSIAAFHSGPVCRAFAEGDREAPDRDQKIEKHKQDSVNKAKSGKGEWKSELASSSEQHVAADKHNLSDKEMQEMGKKKGESDQGQ